MDVFFPLCGEISAVNCFILRIKTQNRRLLACYALCKVKFFFSYYPIQGYIPDFLLQYVHFLKFMGNADQFRFSPKFPGSQISESSIIVSASHAETISLWVKSDQWQQYQIKPPRWSQVSCVYTGFFDMETVAQQAVTGAVFGKPKGLLWSRTQHWKITLLFQFTGLGQDKAGGHFPILFQIKRYSLAVKKEWGAA
jgi:hypothetical protein